MRASHVMRNRVNIVFVTAFAVSISLSSVGYSQDAEQTDAGSCYDGPPRQRIEELLNYWQRDDPVGQALSARTDITMVRGAAAVGRNAYERDWGKYRSTAYVRAYVDATHEFVKIRRGEFTTEVVREFLRDDSDILEDSDPNSYIDRIGTKAAALLEAKLDSALQEEGLSEDDIEDLTATQKVVRFRDSLVRRSTAEASGSASGLVPVKTVEVVNCEGDTAIGVVLVFSRRMGRFASQIANGDPIVRDPERAGVSVSERLNGFADSDLVTEFGVRRWWDDQGYPTIIAFGQWGWNSANLNSRQQDRAWQAAKRQAQDQAISYLTEFINLATLFQDESERGEIQEEATERDRNGIVENIDTTRMIDRIMSTARTKSRVDLTGLTTLRTWSATHPLAKDQELVGAVVYWSPALEDSARKGLGLSTKHAPPEQMEEQRAEPTASRVEGGTTENKVQTDAADF